MSDTEVCYRHSDDVNSVNHARKDLLRKCDWVGVTTTLPARLSHGLRDEMAKLGRPRNAIALKRKRTDQQDGSNKKSSFRGMQLIRQVTSLHTEDISVRVGSNIHRTQTTPSNMAGKEFPLICKSVTTQHNSQKLAQEETGINFRDSRALKERDQGIQARTLEDITMSTDEPEHAPEDNLIPLDWAVDLDLSSWDMVRERSSRSKSLRTSSTEGLPSIPQSFATETGVGERFNVSHRNNTATMRPSALGKSPKRSLSPILPAIVQRGVAIGLSGDEAGIRRSLSPFGHQVLFSNHTWSQRPTTPSRNMMYPPMPEDSNIDVRCTADSNQRFTLEEQVELERAVRDLEHGKQQARAFTLAVESKRPDRPRNKIRPGLFHKQPPPLPGDETLSSSLQRECRYNGIGSGGIRSSAYRQDSAKRKATHISEDFSLFAPLRRHLPGDIANAATTVPAEEHLLHLAGDPEDDESVVALSSVSNGNDAWMKFVFPDEFQKVQDDFQVGSGHVQPVSGLSRLQADTSITEPFYGSGGSTSFDSRLSYPSSIAPLASIPTAANTSLFIPSPTSGLASETDFLSDLSPMEGCIDERLQDKSIYNNAPRTERIFDKALSHGSSVVGRLQPPAAQSGGNEFDNIYTTRNNVAEESQHVSKSLMGQQAESSIFCPAAVRSFDRHIPFINLHHLPMGNNAQPCISNRPQVI